MGAMVCDREIWGRYLDSVNLQTVAQYIDPTVFQDALNVGDAKNKFSGKNLAIFFAVANFELWHRMFIEQDDPCSEDVWRAMLPQRSL